MDRTRQALGRSAFLPLHRHEQQHLKNRVHLHHLQHHNQPFHLSRGETIATPCILLHACLMACLCSYCVYAVQSCAYPSPSLPQCVTAACLYLVCLLGVLSQTLTERANVSIASWFYPKRSRQRADWLVGRYSINAMLQEFMDIYRLISLSRYIFNMSIIQSISNLSFLFLISMLKCSFLIIKKSHHCRYILYI